MGTATDPTTAERIAFDFNGPDCHCLTLEEHLGHPITPPASVPRPMPDNPIARDLKSVERLLELQEWKAAAAIGGGVLEALIRARLEALPWEAFAEGQRALTGKHRDRRQDWNRPLERWGLFGLIKCATSLGVLTDEAAALCHRARDARNALHHATVDQVAAEVVRDALLVVLEGTYSGCA